MAPLHQCVVALPPTIRAASEARDASRKALGEWDLRHVLDDTVLIVSELVANSFRHGLPPYSLSLRHSAHELDIEVHDEGDGRPAPVDAPPEAVSGRGLAIVSAIADSVRIAPIQNDGTSVIATLRI